MCHRRNPNRMPLTLNTGSARPSKGVQPGKKGVRFPQHACTTAGDIIELTGAHSQSLHTVEHGTPPPSAKISESPQSCLCPTLLPLLTSLTEAVTRAHSSNSYLDSLPSFPSLHLSRAVTLSLLSFPSNAGVFLFPSQLECRYGS